jgi:hypothetical protein
MNMGGLSMSFSVSFNSYQNAPYENITGYPKICTISASIKKLISQKKKNAPKYQKKKKPGELSG